MTAHQAHCAILGGAIGIGMAQCEWTPEEVGEIAEQIAQLVVDAHGLAGPTTRLQ